VKSHYMLNLGLFRYCFLKISIRGLILPQTDHIQVLIPKHKTTTYKLRYVVCWVS
jgi:hypothetical protein